MDQQEVLVHVTAPSRLQDDRRYQGLADELRRFETASVTHAYGFVGLSTRKSGISTSEGAVLSVYKSTMKQPWMIERPPRLSQVQYDLEVQVPASAGAGSNTQQRHLVSFEPTPASDDSIIHVASNDSSAIILETPANRSERGNIPQVIDTEYSCIKAKWMGRWQVVKGDDTKPPMSMYRVSKNPPFKNPFHGTSAVDLTAQPLRTPEQMRPMTAPAGDIRYIQVPRTLNEAHKRSASDSFLDGSFTTSSTISESQLAKRDVASKGQRSQGAAERERAATEPPADTYPTAEIDKCSQPAKRRRLFMADTEDLMIVEAEDKDEVNRVSTSGSTRGAFEQKYLVQPPPGCTGPFFLPDRSEDWTSPPEASASDASSIPISSTLSPSQTLALRLSQTRRSPNSTHPSPPVDLTSNSPSEKSALRRNGDVREQSSHGKSDTQSSSHCPSNAFNSPPEFATRSFHHNSSPPVRHARSQKTTPDKSSSASDSRRYDFTSSIKSLPDRIEAPPPPTGNGPFVSHVSAALRTMIARLPLAKHFRPVQVKRDVRVLERGYWLIRVRIASKEDVAEARRPPSQDDIVKALQRQMDGATSTQRDSRYEAWKAAGNDFHELGVSKRCDLWTEDEFLGFWEVLTEYVKNGKAGYGLSVAKDWVDEAVALRRATTSTYARIRVYTWGEIVGHMWIALWVLSDKKTAYIPMEWIAMDDTVVVNMSGNRHKGGKLGPWVPKGSPGGKGSWGVDKGGTPPSNQGKHVCLPSS